MNKRIKKLIKRAEEGNAFAQCDLGLCYYYGVEGVEQNYDKAANLLEMAAEKGNTRAQYNLGMCYYNGQGKEQSYEKAVYWLEQAANQKDVDAQFYLGLCYLNGIGVEQNNEKAVHWFKKAEKKAEKKGYADVQLYLGNCYLHGIGTKQNFNEAERLFKESVKNGNKEDEYNTEIFEQLQGKQIKQIKDISEEFNEENVGAVLISPQDNKSIEQHTLYDIETYRKIKKTVNELLKDVEEVNPNKDNEFDVFMKIYTKLGMMISYDEQEKEKCTLSYEPRNLIGGLFKKKCVCAGYAEILRNVLSCRGIDCICISSSGGTHAFNQVKIRGKWYYCDLTNSVYSLNTGKSIEYCLLSKEEFEDASSRIAMENQIVYPSTESYPQEEVNAAVKKIMSSEKKVSHNRVKKDTKSRESQKNGLEKQIDEFANDATLTGLQNVTKGFKQSKNNNQTQKKEQKIIL